MCPLKPDTDVYLMAAILHHLFDKDMVNHEYIQDHADHIEGLRSFIAEYSPQRVASAVGISAQSIAALADDIGAAKSAAFYMSTGVNMGRQGSLAYWLLFMLSVVTGNSGQARRERLFARFLSGSKIRADSG